MVYLQSQGPLQLAVQLAAHALRAVAAWSALPLLWLLQRSDLFCPWPCSLQLELCLRCFCAAPGWLHWLEVGLNGAICLWMVVELLRHEMDGP